jgi:hypothetical protein
VKLQLSLNRRIDWFPSDSAPYGISYGGWTIRWWQWALSIRKSINPVLDSSGKYASINQPENFVWFLAGRFGTQNSSHPCRYCTIPAGRSILFPIINYEANFFEHPQLKTQDELKEHVRKIEDTIVKKECRVNGISVAAQRVMSDPTLFELKIAEDNPVNIRKSGSTIAAADGYWVFLKSLPQGEHSITFEGSCENGKLISRASYNLRVRDFDL